MHYQGLTFVLTVNDFFISSNQFGREDKNGIIRDGRHLSKEQILRTSQEMMQDYQKTSKNLIKIPLEIDDKTFLIDIAPTKV